MQHSFAREERMISSPTPVTLQATEGADLHSYTCQALKLLEPTDKLLEEL